MTRKIKIFSLILLTIVSFCGLTMVNARVGTDNIVEETGFERLTPSMKVALVQPPRVADKIVEETGLERLTPSMKVELTPAPTRIVNIVEETGLER